jgi:glycosyltransferase involved in cell wall biosynthesis
MKVSGFTFVRNGGILGYPYIESIKSLLMLCDEVVVAVGNSDDDTYAQIAKLALTNPKLIIIQTKWNELMQDRGFIYAQQKMIAQFNCSGDWAFYLECDEIIHEKDMPLIRAQMAKYLPNKNIEALVFDYYHFYGSYNNIALSPRWYKRAPRIIRNTIRTFAPDGLFWVVMEQNKRGRYPKAAAVGCHLYHYGHVRLVSAMNEKNQRVERYWGKSPTKFADYGNIDATTIKPFTGEHPAIISPWLATAAESKFMSNPDYQLTIRDKRHRLLMLISKWCGGLDFSKKHYRLVK